MKEALKYLKENEEEAIKFIPKYDLNEIAKVMQKYTDQQFAIQRVSQQRELLLAYESHCRKKTGLATHDSDTSMVEDFLTNNCG